MTKPHITTEPPSCLFKNTRSQSYLCGGFRAGGSLMRKSILSAHFKTALFERCYIKIYHLYKLLFRPFYKYYTTILIKSQIIRATQFQNVLLALLRLCKRTRLPFLQKHPLRFPDIECYNYHKYHQGHH